MRKLLFLTVSVILLVVQDTVGADSLRGFSKEASKAQRALEEKIRRVPKAANLREYIRVMSEEPHHTGSEGGKRVAAYVLEKFEEWGLDASIEVFDGLMPTPRERRLELLEPEYFFATLKEPALPEDKDSSDIGQLPTYNAYSADGDVTGQIVYVNYGMPDDYEVLEKLGVSVKGKIVLARYFGGWRGIKPKLAASFTRIPKTTAITATMFIRWDKTGPRTVCSAAARWTCRFIRATRFRPVGDQSRGDAS